MWKSDVSSYPPPFRQSNSNKEASRAQEGFIPKSVIPNFDNIIYNIPVPVVDLNDLDTHTLAHACRDWGIFGLTNHGVPRVLSDNLQSYAETLFALPFESKQTLFAPPSPITYFWGSPAVQLCVHRFNWVEGFHSPLASVQNHASFGQHIPSLLSFRHALEEYGKHMVRIGRTVFDAMAEALKLDQAQRASFLSDSDGLFRVYRYPSFPGPEEVLGMDAHTDSSLLSILNQDEVGGLQVLLDHKWVHVKPMPDTLIVNLGDMIQAISNDEYKSVKHRVATNMYKDRLSICYFTFPVEDKLISSSSYKPFTYKEYRTKVQEDIKTIGFKVEDRLQHFKVQKNGNIM